MKMKRHGSTLGCLFVLALLAAARAEAPQNDKLQSPRATVQTLFVAVNAARQNPKYIGEATACLDLSGLPASVRDPDLLAVGLEEVLRAADVSSDASPTRLPLASTLFPVPTAASSCAGSRTAAGCSTLIPWSRFRKWTPRRAKSSRIATKRPPPSTSLPASPHRARRSAPSLPTISTAIRSEPSAALTWPKSPPPRDRRSASSSGPQALPDHLEKPIRHLPRPPGFQLQRRLRLAVASGRLD